MYYNLFNKILLKEMSHVHFFTKQCHSEWICTYVSLCFWDIPRSGIVGSESKCIFILLEFLIRQCISRIQPLWYKESLLSK